MEGHKPTPAIVRDYCDADDECTVLSTPYDRVSFTRGMGDSGYRVQVVEHDCPADHCSFDRMVRRVDVNPEFGTEVRYWCLSPNCGHYLGESMSYAFPGSYPNRNVKEPAVSE